jgi:hypothetical protein
LIERPDRGQSALLPGRHDEGRLLGHSQAWKNLLNRILAHPDLLHRITPGLVAAFARPHLGLVASG